jgi:putative ABC transport system ATP-binding protein
MTGAVAGDQGQVFRLRGVSKRWPGQHGFVLKVEEFIVRRGEKVALVGSSGCGKSTLLDLLAMTLRPDRAVDFLFFPDHQTPLNVFRAWQRKKLSKLARTRMVYLGYVLQTGGLLPFLSVRDNIALGRQGLGLPVKEAVEAIAERLHIERHLDKLPSILSVGERQRVAIARALAHRPSVVIADEPTASLDPINAEEIMALFTELVDEAGGTLVLATHDWRRVEKSAFRRVEFQFEQDPGQGTVSARVVGL